MHLGRSAAHLRMTAIALIAVVGLSAGSARASSAGSGPGSGPMSGSGSGSGSATRAPQVSEAALSRAAKALVASDPATQKAWIAPAPQSLILSPTQRADLRRRTGTSFPSDTLWSWAVATSGEPRGWILHQALRGRYHLFQLLAVVDNQGVLRYSEVVEYPASRGLEATRPAWLRHFVGKDRNSGFRIGRDVDAASGASITSPAIAAGLQRAVLAVPTAPVAAAKLGAPSVPGR